MELYIYNYHNKISNHDGQFLNNVEKYDKNEEKKNEKVKFP